MKQFRDTPYYITEEGKVFRYYPERFVKNGYYVYKGNKVPRLQKRPSKHKPLNPVNKTGYETVDIYFKGESTRFYVHRLVAEVYCDGYFEGAHVDHIDCNKSNNHYTNLQWCTKEYNHKKGTNTNYPLFQI